jgi:hypothetical protein
MMCVFFFFFFSELWYLFSKPAFQVAVKTKRLCYEIYLEQIYAKQSTPMTLICCLPHIIFLPWRTKSTSTSIP